MLQIIFNIINSLLGITKRLLCFLNIKRRRKTSGNILPMHAQVPSANDLNQSVSANDQELEAWDSWGMDTAQAQQQQAGDSHTKYLYGRQVSQEESEPEPDFFSDMTPQFRKAKKILVRKKEDTLSQDTGFSNRLAVQSNIPLNQDPALGAWEDSENAWADEASEDLSWQAQDTLKENRRQEREARAQQQVRRKQEREAQRSQQHYQRGGAGSHLAAVKLS